MKYKKTLVLLSALILSLGILGSGYLLGKFIYYSKIANRTVTVKGLAERDVKADLGIFELDYREVGDDLVVVNKRLQHDQQLITTFLKQNGFTDDELSLQTAKVEDRLANVYSPTSTPAAATPNRYVVTTGIRVRSTRVDLIDKVYQLSGDLLQQGIAMIFDSPALSSNPSFYFTQLDKIRPDILAEATHSARALAEQFTQDSGARLDGIQHANQGVFQIMGRDSSAMSSTDVNFNQSALATIDKKVRLVVTIEYRLK